MMPVLVSPTMAMGGCRAHGEMKVKINRARSVQPMSPRLGYSQPKHGKVGGRAVEDHPAASRQPRDHVAELLQQHRAHHQPDEGIMQRTRRQLLPRAAQLKIQFVKPVGVSNDPVTSLRARTWPRSRTKSVTSTTRCSSSATRPF